MDDIQTAIVDGSEDDEDTHTGGLNHDDEDIHDYSTTGTPPPSSTPSPTSYEHCLLSFLVGNDSLTSTNNRDDKITSSDIKKILPIKKQLLIEKKQTNNTSTTILNNNNKKRRVCMSCGKCYHPSSLQRHYRQCKRQSAFRQLNPSNSKLLDETTLKTVNLTDS